MGFQKKLLRIVREITELIEKKQEKKQFSKKRGQEVLSVLYVLQWMAEKKEFNHADLIDSVRELISVDQMLQSANIDYHATEQVAEDLITIIEQLSQEDWREKFHGIVITIPFPDPEKLALFLKNAITRNKTITEKECEF